MKVVTDMEACTQLLGNFLHLIIQIMHCDCYNSQQMYSFYFIFHLLRGDWPCMALYEALDYIFFFFRLGWSTHLTLKATLQQDLQELREASRLLAHVWQSYLDLLEERLLVSLKNVLWITIRLQEPFHIKKFVSMIMLREFKGMMFISRAL